MNTRFALVASLFLAGGVLANPALAQDHEQIPFPLTVDAQALVEGTYDMTPIPGAYDKLQKPNDVYMTDVPLPGHGKVNLDLERIAFDFSSMGIYVNGEVSENFVGDLSVWKGTVLGDPGSEVMLGFSSYGSYGFVKTQGEFHHLIAYAGPQNDWANALARFVPDEVMMGLNVPSLANCQTDTSGAPLSTRSVPDLDSSSAATVSFGATTLKCDVAVETDNQYYQNWNSLSATQNYTNVLLAAISDRYSTSIDTNLYYPYVAYWTIPDPWTQQNNGTAAMLNEFRMAWEGAIPNNANLGHFITGAPGGGRAYLDVLCDDFFGFGVSHGLTGGTQFPVSQSSNTWDFVVVAHELGHNFGSSHTHDWCPTPLDTCADSANYGTCQTSRTCINNGTIMSYCHTCSGGMNNITTFFHPSVNTVMRAAADASCLPLDSTGCVADSFEPNNDCFTAAAITEGTHTGLASCDIDDDYYSILVPPGAAITVSMAFTDAIADLDLEMEDSGCGSTLDGSYSTGDSETVNWTNATQSSVEVKIRVYMYTIGVASNAYDMTITIDGCASPDVYEDNDDCASAAPIGNQTVTGLTVDKLDKDMYSVCVAAGATITIDCLHLSSIADVDTFLWDAADVNCGTATPNVALVQGYTSSDNETMVWTNNTGNALDCVIEVMVWDQSAGDCNSYDLIVSGSGDCLYLGSEYCDPGWVNSSGNAAQISGSITTAGSGLHLEMTGGPPNELGYFILGNLLEPTPFVPLGNGFLCLGTGTGSVIGRYNIAGGEFQSLGVFSAGGVLQNLFGTSTTGTGFDVPQIIPVPGNPVIMSGFTVRFQGWFRDTPAGVGQSNASTAWTQSW